jgi:hypothetical protein
VPVGPVVVSSSLDRCPLVPVPADREKKRKCSGKMEFRHTVYVQPYCSIATEFLLWKSVRGGVQVCRAVLGHDYGFEHQGQRLDYSAAWQHEHEYVNTTTRWDNCPLQMINWSIASGAHDGVEGGEHVERRVQLARAVQYIS